MRRYAQDTEVPVERSRAEIERLLKAHGASQFGSASDEEKGIAFVMFKLQDRMFRIEVVSPTVAQFKRADPPPPPEPHKNGRHPYSREQLDQRDRTEYERVLKRHDANENARAQRWLDGEERRRWRAQLLLLKAKLEMVAMGATTVEREFMADMLMANGQTVAQHALPQIEAMYRDGKMPKGGILMLGSGR